MAVVEFGMNGIGGGSDTSSRSFLDSERDNCFSDATRARTKR